MGNCLSRPPPEPVVEAAPPVIPELRLDLPRRWPTLLRRDDDPSSSGGSASSADVTTPADASATPTPTATGPSAAALATLAGAPRRPLPRSVSAPYGRARTFPRGTRRPVTTTDGTPLPSLPSIEVEPTNWSGLLHSGNGNGVGSSHAVDDIGVGAKRRSVSFQVSGGVGPEHARARGRIVTRSLARQE